MSAEKEDRVYPTPRGETAPLIEPEPLIYTSRQYSEGISAAYRNGTARGRALAEAEFDDRSLLSIACQRFREWTAFLR